MTVTELRKALEILESQGYGNEYVCLDGYDGAYDSELTTFIVENVTADKVVGVWLDTKEFD